MSKNNTVSYGGFDHWVSMQKNRSDDDGSGGAQWKQEWLN